MQHLPRFLALFATFLGVASVDSYISSLVLIQHSFNVPYHYMQITVIITPALAIILSPLYGLFASQLSVKTIFSTCLFILVCGFLLACFSTNFGIFFLARIIQGIGSIGITFSTLPLIMGSNDKHTLKKLSGIFSFLMPISWCASPILGSLLISLYGFRSPFFVLLIFSIVCLGSFLFFSKRYSLESPIQSFELAKFKRCFMSLNVALLSCIYAFPLGLFCFWLTINPLICADLFRASPQEIAYLQSFAAAIVVASSVCSATFFNPTKPQHKAMQICWVIAYIALLICTLAETKASAIIVLILHNSLAGSLIGLVTYPALQLLTITFQHKDQLKFSAFISTIRNTIISALVFCFSFSLAGKQALYSPIFVLLYPCLIISFIIISRKYHEQYIYS